MNNVSTKSELLIAADVALGEAETALRQITGFEGLPMSTGQPARFATIALAQQAARRDKLPMSYVRPGELGGEPTRPWNSYAERCKIRRYAPAVLWWGLHDGLAWFRWQDLPHTRLEIDT